MDEVLVCRCEEVGLEDLLQEWPHAPSVDAVKRGTRLGMGVCQGRVCRPLTDRLISVLGPPGSELPEGSFQAGTSNAELAAEGRPSLPGYRNPARPVPVARLAQLDRDAGEGVNSLGRSTSHG